MSTQAEYKFIIRFIALHRIVVCNAQVIGVRVSARGFSITNASRTNECKTRRGSSNMRPGRINGVRDERTFLKEFPRWPTRATLLNGDNFLVNVTLIKPQLPSNQDAVEKYLLSAIVIGGYLVYNASLA